MIAGFPGTAVLTVVIAGDMSKPITLEGRIQRVEWINPHILLYLESKNEKGEPVPDDGIRLRFSQRN